MATQLIETPTAEAHIVVIIVVDHRPKRSMKAISFRIAVKAMMKAAFAAAIAEGSGWL